MSHQFYMKNEILLVEAKTHDPYYRPSLYFDNNLVYNHQLNCKEQYQVTKFSNKANEVLLNHCNRMHSRRDVDLTIPKRFNDFLYAIRN